MKILWTIWSWSLLLLKSARLMLIEWVSWFLLFLYISRCSTRFDFSYCDWCWTNKDNTKWASILLSSFHISSMLSFNPLLIHYSLLAIQKYLFFFSRFKDFLGTKIQSRERKNLDFLRNSTQAKCKTDRSRGLFYDNGNKLLILATSDHVSSISYLSGHEAIYAILQNIFLVIL